jgi:hypothetical protein
MDTVDNRWGNIWILRSQAKEEAYLSVRGLRRKWNDIPARRPPPREARRPLRPTRSPWTIWITPGRQQLNGKDNQDSPTRTTSTPRRRVFNPPSIAMINAPYLSALTLEV